MMFGRNARLPVDVLVENGTDEQSTRSMYIEKWKCRMKGAFAIAAANSKRRNSMGKRKRDQKREIAVGGRVLVRNLNERGEPGKTRVLGQHKVYKIL